MSARHAAALGTASLGYFFVLLDVTIVNVALAQIGSGLGAGTAELQWVVDGYALALASLMLSAGDLGDLLGHRRVFAGGLALFLLASGACGLAPSAAVLIGARAVQGVGAAAILPTSLAITNRLYPEPRRRARAIGYWAAVGSLALVAGPLVGGLLVDAYGWRAVFWLNVPLLAVALALALAFVPESTARRGASIDVRGQLLGAVALGSLTFAFIEGGRLGFASTAVVVAVMLTVAAAVAFVWVELRARRPMVELRHFREPTFTAANLGAGLMNLGTLGALFALSLFLQQVQGHSPAATGVRLLPWLAPLALLTPLTGRLVGQVGPRVPAAAGLGLAGFGYLLLSGLGPGSGYGELVSPLLLAGLGLALATPALVAAATGSVPAERAGMASAVNNTSRQTGGAVGVALLGGLHSIHASLGAGGVALLAGAASAAVIGVGAGRGGGRPTLRGGGA